MPYQLYTINYQLRKPAALFGEGPFEAVFGLPYVANDQQVKVIAALARFCGSATPSDSVFMLCGYAGTGKTSLVGTLVRTLREIGMWPV